MWIDHSGWAHVEDQYDPSTWAEENEGDVDWDATRKYRGEQEERQ